MNILESVVLLLSLKTGFCEELTGSCRPFCTGNDCITLNQDRVDFKTAEEACRDRNGELVSLQQEADDNIFDILSQELHGNFWVGLHLPARACGNLSEWTSAGVPRSSVSSSSTWKDGIKVCSRCVSLSNDQKWMERPCSDKADGFLCRTKHRDACRAQALSDLNIIKSSEGCSSGPCEHECKDVKGGFQCSCFSGYIPDSENPRRCKIHCAKQKCPALCGDGVCYCADGFIRSEKICMDIDECWNGHCDQECKNTFGSFVCSCREGFVLKDEVKCINATPADDNVFKPGTNGTRKASSAATGSFLWLWILAVVVVVGLVFAIRFYVVRRQRRREQNSIQQATVLGDNIGA